MLPKIFCLRPPRIRAMLMLSLRQRGGARSVTLRAPYGFMDERACKTCAAQQKVIPYTQRWCLVLRGSAFMKVSYDVCAARPMMLSSHRRRY